MNLKEAFQAQNKIDELFIDAAKYLKDVDNITVVKEKHFRKKAAEGQTDEELDVTDYNEKIFEANKVIKFMIFLISEREKLSRAIHSAKVNSTFDFDTAVDVNKKRHTAVEVLREMSQLKSSGTLKKNSGTGYVFNKEGNQTTFRYDVEVVRTIDFDRNKVRSLVKKLQAQADKVSNEIDAALLNIQVEYVLPFDSHASLAEILEDPSASMKITVDGSDDNHDTNPEPKFNFEGLDLDEIFTDED